MEFGTGQLSKVMRLYSSGTGEKVADLGVLWNLREQSPVRVTIYEECGPEMEE